VQITLDPDVEARVNELLARRPSATAAQLVNTALRLNLDPPEMHRRYDELKRLIQEGVESAERRELHDADEVFDELLAELGEHGPA
jgi:Arc/MetJ-type ribon-helix-helix transcriptional regulator